MLINVEKDKKINDLEEKVDSIEKKLTIFGISIWRWIAYFIIYSILGYFIETIFCIVKYGVLESRKSFLYGPFCSIYGIGAIIIIKSLQYFKKNYHTLFFGGCIVGSILEYCFSWIGEKIFNVKWWDYSDLPLNLNGRICLVYALFWGALSLYLIVFLNPKIDNIINRIKKKLNINILKTAVISLLIAIVIDCCITAYALTCFMIRTIKNYDIDVLHKDRIIELYDQIYLNEKKSEFIYKYFGDEKMLKTFPRLKIQNANGEVIFFSDILSDIQPYYYKIWK